MEFAQSNSIFLAGGGTPLPPLSTNAQWVAKIVGPKSNLVAGVAGGYDCG